jgi:hypothetical protein
LQEGEDTVKKQHVVLIGVLVLLIMVGATSLVGYQQGWIRSPDLSVALTARWPDGTPLEHVSIQALGQAQGETDAEGKLSFQLQSGIGEEVHVSASLDRPGMRFEPWEGTFVVRKWDRSDLESLRYSIDAVLKPKSVSATIQIVAGGDPIQGATVFVGGRTKGKTDSDGRLTVDLGARSSRPVGVSVKASRFKPWGEKVTLRGGDTLLVNLERVGAVSSRLTTAYESLGRIIRVSGAEVRLGQQELGKTDAQGRFRFSVPEQGAKITVQKLGVCAPALPGGSAELPPGGPPAPDGEPQ